MSDEAKVDLARAEMRELRVERDQGKSLSTVLDDGCPLYHIKNKITVSKKSAAVTVSREDGSPVGFVAADYTFNCKLDVYADEALTQRLTTVERDGGSLKGKWRFDLDAEGGGTDRYHWKPTTFLGMGLSYKLLDEGGNLLALYDYNSKSLKNEGTIYVAPELSTKLIDAVMLTLAAILEKRRRESPTTQYYCL
ncbi:hypothetical protein AAVH_36114 [Aphelenchoides avenae]|nr:hypothetical protein AAVH_36114 [Aphelenchus avenae]